MTRPDCLIIVGHSEASRGAIAADGSTEWDFHKAIAPEVVHALYAMGYSAECRWRLAHQRGEHGLRALIAQANALRPRCVVELHANASAPNRHGVEVLHWPGSVAGKHLAEHMLREVGPLWRGLPQPVHRVVAQARSWNGPAMSDSSGRPVPGGPPLEILKDTAMPAVILETHYLTHAESVRVANVLAQTGQLAEAIARGAASWLATQR